MRSMNRIVGVSVGAWLLIVGAAGASPARAAQNVPPEGFRALFNGRDLEGWFGHGTKDPRTLWKMSAEDLEKHKEATREDLRAHWRAEGGELINDGHGLYATTNEDFGDFELLLEYRTVAKADSGIYLRGAPQVQIWDSTEEGGKWGIGAGFGSGGLWNNRPGAPGKDPVALADRAFGEWNRFRIVMVGERVTVFLNDVLVVDHARMENYFDRSIPIFRKGPIQLQTHGGEIRWRNVFIREIGPLEANEILRRGGVARELPEPGFAPLFNGVDFRGWGGAVEQNGIEDGQILARHGTLFHTSVLTDFEVKFEFQLPPGGNNGLAIRYPGKGDPAYSGMCELQVLDNPHSSYDGKLDARQYHGSAYGMAAAHRGFLRPTGQWNQQRVIVRGSTIRVELNGTRILDTDLSKLKTFMYEEAKFKSRLTKQGHFGFAGHGSPVRFRRIELRRLD